MQLKYSKGDNQFEGDDTLYFACVEVIQSGNEHVVQQYKMLWFLKCGCAYQLFDTDFIYDFWETWTFRVNFMYDKFL